MKTWPEGMVSVSFGMRLDMRVLAEQMTYPQLSALMGGIAKVLAISGDGVRQARAEAAPNYEWVLLTEHEIAGTRWRVHEKREADL